MKGSSFDELMREAVAIKSAQLGRLRKKFDTWPQFQQAGLYYADKFSHLREASLSEKIRAFNEKKDEGTRLFKEGDFQKALFRYEESLCVFRWVSSKNLQWKNSGIEDSDLTVHTEELSPVVIDCLVTCYSNIALCNLRIDKCADAVIACDEALKLQPNNAKVLYRKAIALTQPAGSSLDDYKVAIKLLKQAAVLDATNDVIKGKLLEFKEFLRVQRKKTKETFHSFFKKPINIESINSSDNSVKLKEFDMMIEKAEEIAKEFKSTGRNKEAKSLLKKTKEAKKLKSEFNRGPLDVDNPTENMLKNAAKYGLDLNDPLIKAEIKRLKNEQYCIPDSPKPKQKPPKVKSSTFSDNFLIGFLIVLLVAVFWYEFSNSLTALS